MKTARERAEEIIGKERLDAIERAKLIVVDVELLELIENALWKAPGPWDVDHEGYTQWHDDAIDVVARELERALIEYRHRING